MSTPAKKPSFGDLMSNLSKFSQNPTTKNKIAALGDHTDQGRKETGISAPANEAAVNEMTHLSGGAEASKRESEINPQGVPTGTKLPDQPSLQEKELEREEKPVGASVNKEASGETAQEILARFKSNLKLAEGGTEGDSPVAKAVLAGKPAPSEAVTTPSEGASRTLEAAKVHNEAGSSAVAKDVLDGSPVSDKTAGTATATVDLDVLAQKTAAWMQHTEFGYEAGRQMFAPFARLMKEAAAFSPAAFLQELKVAEYVPIVPDRAVLETAVNERTSQLKTAGRNDAEISEFLKAAGAEDRRMIDFENAVRQDERQKVAAELQLDALVITKVAHYQALGMTEPEIRAALQKDAEADAAAMMAGGPGGAPDPGAGGGAPGGAPAGPGGPGGIDPAQVMQLNQAIQAFAAQNGLSEEQVIQMLEQEAQGAGGAPGGDPNAGTAGGGMPPGAAPDPSAGGAPGGMPPGAVSGGDAAGASDAGGSPVPDGGAGAGDEGGGDKPPKKKEDKEDGDDDGGEEEKKEAARVRKISPEIENLFAAIDAQVSKGSLKPQAAQKMAHALLAEIK